MSPIRFRKRLWLLPPFVFVTASRSGLSLTVKVGWWSWNSRTERHTVDLPGPVSWRSSRRSGFPWLALLVLVPGLGGSLAGLGWLLLTGRIG